MQIVPKADTLVILLEGYERLWSLRSSVILPRQKIIDVSWNDGLPKRELLSGFRFPGTSLPGVFYAGSFYHGDGWEFCYLKMKQPGELSITTNKRKYHTIRLSTDEATAFLVQEWFNRFKHTKHIA